jgi:hypothetical protein
LRVSTRRLEPEHDPRYTLPSPGASGIVGDMSATLNITYSGRSVSYPVPETMADHDIRRTAVELLRSGIEGFKLPELSDRAFDNFVIDRTLAPGDHRMIYLRPKVPFG